jgi:enoyl-CoA hydratase
LDGTWAVAGNDGGEVRLKGDCVSQFKHLVVDVEETGVVIVRLARPPANAVNQEMYREIADVFTNPDQLANNVKAIVLAGSGPHFCAGNDLDEFASMTPENGTERMWRVREAFFAIEDCPVPVIGAVHGVALGTGLAIAASCDFVVADKAARFGLPELTVGVMGGARHLARLAAQPLVRRMYFTGDHLRADEFAAAGASIFVCSAEHVLDEARRFALRAASFSPTAVRLAKRILNRIEAMDMRRGYEFEQRYTVKMSGHPDSKESLRAFAERRPAIYKSRSPAWEIDV